MSDNDAAFGNRGIKLRQAAGNVFIRQAVKTVAPHALLIEALGDRVTVGEWTVRAMKRSIKARHLKQFRPLCQERVDRGEIVRLVEGGERTELFEPFEHIFVDYDCSIIVRTAVNDAVSDRRKLDFLGLAQPIARGAYRGGDVRNFLRRIRLVDERLAVARLGPQPWPCINSVKLAFDVTLRVTGGSLVKYLEFDTR